MITIERTKMLTAMVTDLAVVILAAAPIVRSQPGTYPDRIRGYKVENTVVELDRPPHQTGGAMNSDSLIQFGEPQLARITPLGITFEVPIVVAAVRQSGHIKFLMFENFVINGTSVHLEEYRHAFDLPNKSALTLRDPLRIYIYLPSAVLAAVGEWTNSKERWPVTGRIYVFGKFKKGILSFKRCIPVDLNLTMRNPLRSD